MDAESYFQRIREQNRQRMELEKSDYWRFFPFSTQVKIIEYLIINFPKRVNCHALPFAEDEQAIEQKRLLLKGLERIPDMCEAVRKVKEKLSILHDVLEITPLDNFSEQCYPSRSLYTDTKNWNNALMEELWVISDECERSKYFSVKHERHSLLHHEKKFLL